MEVPLALEGLTPEEIELVCEVFRSGHLTMGSRVKNFESEFAAKLGAKFAVMVNSGSSANLLALEVLRNKIRASKEKYKRDYYIAVPAVLWPTSLWPIIQLGFKALLIDTKPDSLEINFAQLREAKSELGEKLIGAVLIHPLGKCLDLEEIDFFKSLNDFFILEDNCESLGAGERDRYAGTVGDFGSYSFYYSHHMTTVEGGMITTNDESLANDLLSMRAHGWTRNRLDKKDIENSFPNLLKEFLFVTPGYNFRPMEFQGALGSSQLKRLDNFIAQRISNASYIQSALTGSHFSLIGQETLISREPESRNDNPVPHSWMALPILCSSSRVKISDVMDQISATGISTRPLLAGDFSSQPAGNYPGVEKYGLLENSKKLYANSFMLGNHHNYSEEQMNFLAQNLVEISKTI